MNDQNTSEQLVIAPGSKVKDPKRVAAEKRLGAISRQAKEAKALRLERQSAETDPTSATQAENNNYTLYLVGGLVVVGAVSYLYLNKEKVISNKKKLQLSQKSQPLLLKESLSAFSTNNK